ncbi:T-complex protein 1 subunit delta isoform X2 [Nasonia vitripennis]|uniref:Uncharacterized protein n=1 Tax=Nasonia vitripennis TaxID=7425 RepID=A0A7M7PVH0_NASVI|nr:T-complex protein 1 subunit delta isoform X2 [Nasonia vitripennis]
MQYNEQNNLVPGLLSCFSNINATKVSYAIRTSLGPRGMHKMIRADNSEVTITNDGASILKEMNVMYPPSCKNVFHLVELSRAQDIKASDGTTSVIVIAGKLSEAVECLLQTDIDTTFICDAFQKASAKTVEYYRTSS